VISSNRGFDVKNNLKQTKEDGLNERIAENPVKYE
jgi:hypothetical protein